MSEPTIPWIDGHSVLITGGTGSFGKAFVRNVLKRAPNIKRLVIFSRDELKQFEMSQVFTMQEHRASASSSVTSATMTAWCAPSRASTR